MSGNDFFKGQVSTGKTEIRQNCDNSQMAQRCRPKLHFSAETRRRKVTPDVWTSVTHTASGSENRTRRPSWTGPTQQQWKAWSGGWGAECKSDGMRPTLAADKRENKQPSLTETRRPTSSLNNKIKSSFTVYHCNVMLPWLERRDDKWRQGRYYLL